LILYLLVRTFSFILPLLPLSPTYWLAERIADLTFFVWRAGRANMVDNMRHVLGPEASRAQAVATARQAMRNYLRYLVDFLRMPRMTAGEVLRRVHFPNLDALHHAMELGKGVIIVGLHMGNWDFAGSNLAMQSFPVDGVADTFPNRRLNAFVDDTRQRFGTGVIPREKASRRILNALRRGRVVALAMDLPQTEEQGIGVQFLGCKAYVHAGAAMLSVRTGAPIVPAGVIRLADNSFLGLMSPECITYEPTGDYERDIVAVSQHIVDALGQWIQSYPDQWYVFRRIWPHVDQESLLSSA